MFKKKKKKLQFISTQNTRKKENHTQRTAAFSTTVPEPKKFQTRLSFYVQAQSRALHLFTFLQTKINCIKIVTYNNKHSYIMRIGYT